MRNKIRFYRTVLFTLLFLLAIPVSTEEPVEDFANKTHVYTFSLHDEIAPAALRKVAKAFKEAAEIKADLIIMNLNTYGGMVNIADSISSILLNSKIPVYVLIENNAASAGAFISISADSIYMKKGSSIGAASVVNQTGEVMPEKYQSFMRSKMRAAAESHGKKPVVNNGDTTYVWHRDPLIAEGMVDPRVVVPGIVDSSRLITFTTTEAIENGFCEGEAATIEEVLALAKIEEYHISAHQETALDKLIALMLIPMVQSLFLMLIIGGIYFELQSPGIGFPLAAAIVGAVLYFAPLYLEGLAANWELVLFLVGIALILVEIFAIPGFGIAGISGIVLTITGLALSMIDNIVFTLPGLEGFEFVAKSFSIVILSGLISFIGSIYLGKKLLTSSSLSFLALSKQQSISEGYISVDMDYSQYIGQSGVAYTVLRPGGKVEIKGEILDAIAEIGFIDKGTEIKVIRFESGQLHVIKR